MIKEEWQEKINFDDIFSQYHLLTQDKIKYFVQESKGPERYMQIASLVTTHRLFKYSENFHSIGRKLEAELNTLRQKIEKISETIKNLKIKLNEIEQFNLGQYSDIEQFVDNLIKSYNNSCKAINQPVFKNENIKENIILSLQNFKEHIYSLKNNITILVEKSLNDKYILDELLQKKDYYIKICNQNTMLFKSIPLIEKYKNYNYLLTHMEQFNDINNLSEQCEQRISFNNKEIAILENYLVELRSIYSKVDGLELIIKNIENNIEDKVELDKLLEALKSFQCDINVGGNKIEIRTSNEYSQIILGKYIYNLDTTNVRSGFLDEYFIEIMEQIKVSVKDMFTQMLVFQKEKTKIDKDIKLIEDEIKMINSLEVQHKNILSEALGYIENQGVDPEGEINCPLCNASYNFSVLVKKIQSQLHQDNPLIQSKINDRNLLKTKN